MIRKSTTTMRVAAFLLAVTLVFVSYNVFVSGAFSQNTNYLHYSTTAINVGDTTTTNRYMNTTGPLEIQQIDEISSDSLYDVDFYTHPDETYDLNLSGDISVDLRLRVSKKGGQDARISTSVEIRDWNPVTQTSSLISSASGQELDNQWTWHNYNMNSLNYIIDNGHRIILRVHPYVSTPGKKVDWRMTYDETPSNSRVILNTSQVETVIDMTVPTDIVYGSEGGVFNMTCQVSCNYGTCYNVTLIPQYCVGTSCTDYGDMNLTTALSAMPYTNTSISNGDVFSKNITITENILDQYRVRCRSNASNAIWSNSTQNESVEISDVDVTNITYENSYEFSIVEYETSDTIDWLNITASVYNATAGGLNITVSLLDPYLFEVSWLGPDTQSCGNQAKDTACEKQFDNSSSGYLIDLGESGIYKIKAKLEWATGVIEENTSMEFEIHDLQSEFLSVIDDAKVSINESTVYNVSLKNLWSQNLTSANITVNCADELNCTCLLLGQESQNYCDLGNITTLSREWAPFNISTNSSTTAGDYYINVTINYTNPGNEVHSWKNEENRILSVVGTDILRAEIYNPPTEATRGANLALKGFSNNTALTSFNESWLNWSYPATWTLQSGTKNTFIGNVTPEQINWSNVTVYVELTTTLGSQEVILKTNNTQDKGDEAKITVDVFATTQITNQQSNDTDPLQGDSILLRARLRYDNGTAINGVNLVFNDTTEPQLVGSSTTNTTGWANKTYTLASDATVGTHTIVISYIGDEANYVKPTSSNLVINVHDIPVLENITTVPEYNTGYGYNITISADAYDEDTISMVKINITKPDMTSQEYDMVSVGGNTYEYNYTVWTLGDYTHTINVTDDSGFSVKSAAKQFKGNATLYMGLKTEKDVYGPTEDVNISGVFDDWWNSSFKYRKLINVSAGSNDRINYAVQFNVNLSQYLEESFGAGTAYIDTVRILNVSSGTCTMNLNGTCAYKLKGTADDANITIRVNISSGASALFYLYFDNSSSILAPYDYLVYPRIAIGVTDTVGEGNLPVFLDNTTRDYLGYTSGCSWSSVGNDTKCYDTINTFPTIDNYDAFMLEYYATSTPGFADSELSNNEASLSTWISKGGAYFQVVQDVKAISNNDKEFSTFTWVPGDPVINDKWITGDNAADAVNVLPDATHPIFSDPNAINNTDIENIVDSAGYSSSELYNFQTSGKPAGWDVLATANDDKGYAETVMIMEYLQGEGVYLVSQHSTSSSSTSSSTHYNFIENQVKYLTSFRILTSGTQTPSPAEQYGIFSSIRNLGNTGNTYYLLMKVEENSSGSWLTVDLPVVDDVAMSNPRTINAMTRTFIDTIWDGIGGWNTQTNPGGYYRVYVSMRAGDGTILKDHNGNQLFEISLFRITSADINLTAVEHENDFIQEYEIMDTINWINITVTSYDAIALSSNITLNILDRFKNKVAWGPDETQQCGNIAKDASCEKMFDNSTSGYLIPSDVSLGTYTFYWNATMSWENGGDEENNSVNYTIHNIEQNLSSTLDDNRLQTGESTVYNISIYNPWSQNLTYTNITVNCPSITGLNCTCLIAGQESQGYCNLVNITTLSREWAPFNISTNSSTPAGDYYINATINYTNPGSEIHSWAEKLVWLLKIRASGVIITTIVDYPESITRGSTYTNLSASTNNTGVESISDIWLNWTLPYAWSNTSGESKRFNNSLPFGVAWNNITAYVNTSATLGPGTLLRFDADNETYGDWDTVLMTVWANTSITNMTSTNDNPIQGESVTFEAVLRYDNNTVIAGRLLNFNDTTDNVDIGTAITNAQGKATIVYNIAGVASVGNHTLNVSFDGYNPMYINPTWSNFTIWVHDAPVVNEVNVTPGETGYGENVTIQANVTDVENVSTVRAIITFPNTTAIWYDLTELVDDVWQLIFTDTWQKGIYSFYLEAKDIYDKITNSASDSFTIGSTSSVDVYQQKYAYNKNEEINITKYPDDWWNTTWNYRKSATISSGSYTRTNHPVTLRINISEYLFEAGGTGTAYLNSIRVVNTTVGSCVMSSGTCAYQISGDSNDVNITFRVTIPQSTSYTYQIYFDNSSQLAPSAYLVYPRILAGDNNDAVANGDLDETLLLTTTRQYLNYTSGCAWTSTSNMAKCFDTATTDLDTYTMNNYDVFMLEFEAIQPSVDAVQYSDLNTMEIEITNWVQSGGAYFSAAQLQSNIPQMGDIGIYQWLPQDPSINVNYDFRASDNAYILETTHDIFTNPNQITATTLSAIDDGGGGVANSGIDIFNFDVAGIPSGYTTLAKSNDNQGGNKSLIIENTYGEGSYVLLESVVTIDDGTTENLNFTENIVKYLTSFRMMNDTSAVYDLAEPYSDLTRIRNRANYTINGYVIMKIQENSTGSWLDVETVVNDTQTPQLRTLNASQMLYLAPLWDAEGGWNTQTNPQGYYRIRTEFSDEDGNILYDSDSSLIENNSVFEILPPATKLDIIEIRVYNVTGAADNRSGGTFLDSGLNKTFLLVENTEYRVEIIVKNNETSTENWTVSSLKNITHENLNSSWTLYTGDIWYNLSGEKTGGTWSGNVKWNSTLNGNLTVGENMTFAYVVNVSMPYNEYNVKFLISDPDFNKTDFSTFNIVAPDADPPNIYSDIYGMTSYQVNRGSSSTIYGRWDEDIGAANASYNSTEATIYNYTVTLPEPNAENWTNYTLMPDDTWLLGPHAAKIYAEDLQNNLNATLPFLDFEVWGWANISDGSLNPSSIYISNETTIRCRVIDSDTTLAIIGYNMSFYNSTGYMSSNTTNTSGWAQWSFNDYSGGTENITCNITDMSFKYYNDTAENSMSFELFTGETTPPKYYEYGQNTSIVHRNEWAIYYANWSDDSELDYAWIESNETGSFDNNTLSNPLYLGSAFNWSNFTFQMPITSQLGPIQWRIWANDTSENQNKTSFINAEVWGRAALNQSDMSVDPSLIFTTNNTTVLCRVVDENTGAALLGYNVTFQFENSTAVQLEGYNLTNSSGWASYTGGDILSNGTYDMYCLIGDNATGYYNNSASLWLSLDTLTIANMGDDTSAPYIYNNIYALNDTTITRGVSVLAYARWNETVGESRIWYNLSSLGVNLYNDSITLSVPNTENWTNYTIDTNSSWIPGIHKVRVDAKDLFGNWNATNPYIDLEVYVDISVYWLSPLTTITRGLNNYTCRVTADDNGNPISGYSVLFYNGTNDWIGTETTNSSGYAVLEHDTTDYSTGVQTFKCTIASLGFYQATTTQATRDIEIVDNLNTSIINPQEGLNVNVDDTINIDSITKDNFGNPVTPTSINWSNTTDVISTLENDTWSIPYGHSIGIEYITINTSKAFYLNGFDNITIYVWGYSNISWQSPAFMDNFSQGATVPLICNVFDNYTGTGIDNYTISFYVYNETQEWYVGDNNSISMGNATYNWFVDSAVYAPGLYYPKCNITDDADVYYNASLAFETNSTVNITETTITGAFEVSLIVPPELSTTQVAKNRNLTVNATVKCVGGACGDVNGTLQYYNSGTPTNIAVGVGSPFYVNDGEPNPKTCGNMDENDVCNLTWAINVTGAVDSVWNLSALIEGTTSIENRTQNATIEIKYLLILTVTPNAISTWHDVPLDSADNYLGAVNWIEPGTTGTRASSAVTVSLSENSSDANGGVWIMGENLTSIQPSVYEIPVYNVSRCIGNLAAYPTPNSANACLTDSANELRESYLQVASSLDSGLSQDFVLFLDVPYGLSSQVGGYSGTVWVKVNGTA